ncbi:hypothetical protein B7C51_22465 [Paenibacillus larvae subsp. pulvifaciens]|uniref:non-specific protein-tyrosine kinase n=1 Tax=Paenibacillus larvae subsp. pulvifaciens TaxID=1477 RepID=A0A1V0UXX7_9BACL|nr:CpsD/CapB family tyrosine-protein kinase [Paenibacillus larvae]ARF70017.1 hypothetical protein B7C51_22465 [Paenibacillus larvae subsp. pulvifaciens]
MRARKPVRHLFCLDHSKSIAAEVFRTLRTNIRYTGLSRPIHSLVITSSLPGEGKSTVAANLAVAMAQEKKRILLVDADLRKPTQHEWFHIPHFPGLSNVLLGQAPLENAIHYVEDALVHVLPAGPLPPNPSELLGSLDMQQFMVILQKDYDMVLIDSPPILPVSDGLVLSRLADGVLLVIRSGKTSQEKARKAKSQLDHVKAHLIGSVFNAHNLKQREYQYD